MSKDKPKIQIKFSGFDLLKKQLGLMQAALPKQLAAAVQEQADIEAKAAAMREPLQAISQAASAMGVSMAEATDAITKLSAAMNSGSNGINELCVHQWIDSADGSTAQCAKCGDVWQRVTQMQTQYTPAGQLAFHIANLYHVSLSEAEHVVKCVKLNTVPRAQWNTYRNETSRTTQISHVGSKHVLHVKHDSCEIVGNNSGSGAPKAAKAGTTIKVKAPAKYAKPQTVIAPPEPIEREIIEPTQRVVVLPDDDE